VTLACRRGKLAVNYCVLMPWCKPVLTTHVLCAVNHQLHSCSINTGVRE